MKRYVNYMDKINAPEELTERLLGLRERKRAVPVYRLAAAAAALLLVIGAGAIWGYSAGKSISRRGTTANFFDTGSTCRGTTANFDTGSANPGIGETSGKELEYEDLPAHSDDITEPAILPEYNDKGDSPFYGGYEITDGDLTTHYALPVLNFQPAQGMAALDYALGDTLEDAAPEDISAILTDRWRQHLGIPEDAEVSASIWLSGGEKSGFSLRASWEGNTVVIEQLIGYNVPTCCVSPDDDYGHTDVNGVDVVTLVLDHADGSVSCETKFFTNGTGWKATITGDDYEDLTARFVRLGVYEHGTGLAAAFQDSAALDGGSDGSDVPMNEFTTPSYDPNS